MVRNIFNQLFFVVFFPTIVPLWANEDIPKTENRFQPTGPEYTLILKEDLRLGPALGDDFIWADVLSNVSVDDRGWMYVANPGDNRITVLDAQGDFVRHLGRSGTGPGEFQALVSFQILADGRGIAYESKGGLSNLSWYDTEQTFIERIRLGGGRRIQPGALISPNGQTIFAHMITPSRDQGAMTIGWYLTDIQGGQPVPLATFDHPIPRNRRKLIQNTKAFANFLGSMMQSEAKGILGLAAFGDNGSIFTAVANRYEITRWNENLQRQQIITREYRPIPLSEKEIDAAVEPIVDNLRAQLPANLPHLFAPRTIRMAINYAEFPAMKHPINGLAVMADGTLIVTHDISMSEQRIGLDLFDDAGRFIGTASLPLQGMISLKLVFKNGYLFRLEVDERGDTVLVRYRCTLAKASP